MLNTDSVYLLMFGSGLLGGFGHCSGMCGPLVAAYSMNISNPGPQGPSGNVLSHLFYNLGRVTTYSIIGGIMGLTGSFAGVVQSIEKFQNMTMAAIGLLMVVMGLIASGWLSLSGLSTAFSGTVSRISHFVFRVIRFIAETPSPGTFFAVGMTTGFIPCGLLYTAYIAAAGAGAGSHSQAEGFLKGMLMLFLFGMGTTPSLFLIGQVVALKGEWVRRRLYRFSALFMTVIGVILIYRSVKS